MKILISSLLFLMTAPSLSAGQLDNMLSGMAKEMVSALAGTNGKVMAQTGDHVYIDLGKQQGLSEGEILEISAMGEDVIIDPDTGEVLGGAEAEVHKVTVDICRPGHSIVRVPKGITFRKGDQVRRTLTSKAVLLLQVKPVNKPLGEDLKRTVQMGLTVEVSKSGQIKILERDKLDLAIEELEFQQSGLVGKDAIGRLGNFVGADVIGISRMAIFARHVTLFLHLISVKSGEVVASFEQTVKKDEDLYRNLGENPPVDLPYEGELTYEVNLK